jgi:cytoskeletal protein RodZ
VFVRGHLKAYARLLGLSEEVTLAAYRNSDPNADAPPKVTRELERPLTTTPGPTVMLEAVGFALLAMLLVYILSAGDEPARPSAESAPVQQGVPTIELVPALPPAPAPEPESESQAIPVAPAAIPAGDEANPAPSLSGPESVDEPVAAPVQSPPAVIVE